MITSTIGTWCLWTKLPGVRGSGNWKCFAFEVFRSWPEVFPALDDVKTVLDKQGSHSRDLCRILAKRGICEHLVAWHQCLLQFQCRITKIERGWERVEPYYSCYTAPHSEIWFHQISFPSLWPSSPIRLRKKKQSKAARGSTHWYLGVWYGVLHGTCDAIPTCRGVSLSLLREDGWWCGQGLHGQGPGPRGKLLGPNGGSFEGSIFWRLMWYRDTKKMVPGGNHYVRLHVWRELSCSWPYLSMSGTWLERSGNFMSFFVHT